MATIDSSQTQEVSGQLQYPRHVERIVTSIQGIYALVLILVCLAIVLLLAIAGPARFSIEQWACIGFGLEAIAVTYLGLRFRKPWVVSLVVFSSAYTLIPCAAHRLETLLAVFISSGHGPPNLAVQPTGARSARPGG
jgi:hypothetical protein